MAPLKPRQTPRCPLHGAPAPFNEHGQRYGLCCFGEAVDEASLPGLDAFVASLRPTPGTVTVTDWLRRLGGGW